jgi:hypothetical protein
MTWNPNTFHRWLILKAKITDDPVGDFIADSRRVIAGYPVHIRVRSFLPLHRVRSLSGLQRVMSSWQIDAAPQVIAILPDVWERYVAWRDEKCRERSVPASRNLTPKI